MNKRGQITLFVIIAVLLVAAVALFLIFGQNIIQAPVSAEEAQKIVAAQVQPVRDKVEGCMEIAVMKTLNTMGRQGGYIWPKAERWSVPSDVMAGAPVLTYAYFYDKERDEYVNLLPSINEMKDEFSTFMESNPDFEACINNFNSFNKLVDINAGELKINKSGIDFGEKSGKIIMPFNYQLEISKQDSKTIIDDYEVIIPIDMNKIHENAAVLLNGLSSGKSVTVIMQEQALMQEQSLRQTPGSDKIFVSTRAYDDVETELSGEVYNTKTTLFIISYENTGLEEPFNFNFLVGEK